MTPSPSASSISARYSGPSVERTGLDNYAYKESEVEADAVNEVGTFVKSVVEACKHMYNINQTA